VLHPEKYFEPDEPTPIGLEGLEQSLASQWEPFYANTLGEFDLMVLFSLCDVTSADAADMAAGWDGLAFRAFEDQEGQLVLLGSSVWDSEQDAGQFNEGFLAVLGETADSETFTVACTGQYVDFAIGPADPAVRESLLAAVAETR
jgi:hypothetical protein